MLEKRKTSTIVLVVGIISFVWMVIQMIQTNLKLKDSVHSAPDIVYLLSASWLPAVILFLSILILIIIRKK